MQIINKSRFDSDDNGLEHQFCLSFADKVTPLAKKSNERLSSYIRLTTHHCQAVVDKYQGYRLGRILRLMRNPEETPTRCQEVSARMALSYDIMSQCYRAPRSSFQLVNRLLCMLFSETEDLWVTTKWTDEMETQYEDPETIVTYKPWTFTPTYNVTNGVKHPKKTLRQM